MALSSLAHEGKDVDVNGTPKPLFVFICYCFGDRIGDGWCKYLFLLQLAVGNRPTTFIFLAISTPPYPPKMGRPFPIDK